MEDLEDAWDFAKKDQLESEDEDKEKGESSNGLFKLRKRPNQHYGFGFKKFGQKLRGYGGFSGYDGVAAAVGGQEGQGGYELSYGGGGGHRGRGGYGHLVANCPIPATQADK